MWLYLIIFIIPVLSYLQGEAENRNKIFLALYLSGLALFVGLSDMFGGYDRYIYGSLFDEIADGVTDGVSYSMIAALTFYEPGYSFLSYLIALITENRYIFIFLVTTIIYICIYKSFAENMTNYPLAIILFLGLMFFFTFTYLRQVLAFSVAWVGVKYLIDGKKWKFFFIVLLVSLLHKSGIIFAGIYFMPRKKWSKNEVLGILSLCAIVGLSGITGHLYDGFVNSSLVESANAYSTNEGVRIAYFLEVAFFVWIILRNYDKIEATQRNLTFLNMAWAFCGLLLLFIKSSDGGRVAWFFTIGIIYTITLVCGEYNGWRDIKTSLGKLIIVLMLALYVRVYISWQPYNNLYPYKTFLTNGHRYPDYSWQKYEYDHKYDDNKFYRAAFRFLK